MKMFASEWSQYRLRKGWNLRDTSEAEQTAWMMVWMYVGEYGGCQGYVSDFCN